MKDIKYIRWLKRRNEKNLKIRTVKKRRIKNRNRGYALYKKKRNPLNQRYLVSGKKSFKAPEVFSFIENAEETISFFDEILSYLAIIRKNKKDIFIDISCIQKMTIDALMYLIAIINNISENYKLKYSFSGNFPKDEMVMGLLKKSGFLKYVKTNNSIINEITNENVQIKNGFNSNTNSAKSVVDFFAEKSKLTFKSFYDLYDVCIELMSNTYHHAYNNKSILSKVWYLFVENNDNLIKISFLDIGDGIIQTMKKRLTEKMTLLGKKDCEFIMSALKGEFRSRTNQKYRNKGLPTIYAYAQKDEVARFEIISGNGRYRRSENREDMLEEINAYLQGTLYYFEIDLNKLK